MFFYRRWEVGGFVEERYDRVIGFILRNVSRRDIFFIFYLRYLRISMLYLDLFFFEVIRWEGGVIRWRDLGFF